MIRPFVGLAVGAVLLASIPNQSLPTATAQPAATKPLTAELTYVPHDAAIFIHLEAASLWNGPLLKGVREADPKLLEQASAAASAMFGSKPESVQSLTVFWPKFKSPPDPSCFGVVGVFKEPFDKAKLEAGLKQIAQNGSKPNVVKISESIALMLVGLDADTYGKPQPQKPGPQTDALIEASSRKHLLTVGLAPLQLPDEIRRDDLPPEIRAFQPLFNADSIAGYLSMDKELTVDIRVKSSTPPRAKDAEKSLGALASLVADTLGQGLKELRKDGATEPEARDLITILAALQTGAKEAKFSTDGETTRMVAKTTAVLPFASAIISGKKKVEEAAARSQSSNNLKQIALAFHSYHDTFQSMPPAAVCDKTGKPILSWRVLILPYLEAGDLYKEFKLDEPWDGPNNKKLIAKMPKVYSLPGVPNQKPDQTHYRLFVGNGAAHDYLKGPRFADFTDGTSNTILAVTAKDPVIWTKPDELAFDPDKDMTKLLGRFQGNVCMVAFADGSVRALSPKLSKMTLHAMITRGGGEVFNDDE